MDNEFVHRPEILKEFRALFLETYDLREPVVPLERVVHWQAQMETLARAAGTTATTLGRVPTLVFGGYFYHFSSPPPDRGMIEAALAEGRRLGARQWLVPTVPEEAETSALHEAGFCPLPAFVESTFEWEGELDDSLRAVVGSDQLRRIRRHVRRAAERYPLRFYSADEIGAQPDLIPTFAHLHGLNLKQHGLSGNFFSASVLRALLASTLRPHFAAGLRVGARDGLPVQVLLLLTDRSEAALYGLVQGIDHERVAHDVNLFVASCYALYRHAAGLGLRRVRMGRGGVEEKRRLGANRHRLLCHWIRTERPDAAAELVPLAEAARRLLVLDAGDGP
jgi:hypothetical protein